MRRSAVCLALLGCALGFFGGATPALAHEQATGKSIIRNVLPIKIGDVVPDAAFIDEHGRALRLSELRGKTIALAFSYTRCPDPNECPLISANMAGLQHRVAGGPFALLEVSLDPAYDTPARLLAYGKRFDADARIWHLVTGDPEQIYNFAAYFNVSRFDEPQRGIIHNDRTAIIDPSGRLDTIIDETGWSPANVEAQMRAVANGPSNPIARFDLWLSKGFVAVCGNGVAGASGLLDLIILLVITSAFAWGFYRLGRVVFGVGR